MKVTIDRIEDNFIIIELTNGKTFEIPKEIFPNVVEGDIVNIEVDLEETKKKKEKINKLINQVFED